MTQVVFIKKDYVVMRDGQQNRYLKGICLRIEHSTIEIS